MTRTARDEPDAGQPVAEVAERHRGEQHDRQVGDDEEAEAAVAQVEGVLDVGRQHVERRGVPLVEEEQHELNQVEYRATNCCRA